MGNKYFLTIEQIKSTLTLAGERSIIFRPTIGNSFIKLDYKLVCEALDELTFKAKLIEIDLEQPSACDKLLTQLFIAHAEYIYG